MNKVLKIHFTANIPKRDKFVVCGIHSGKQEKIFWKMVKESITEWKVLKFEIFLVCISRIWNKYEDLQSKSPH